MWHNGPEWREQRQTHMLHDKDDHEIMVEERIVSSISCVEQLNNHMEGNET